MSNRSNSIEVDDSEDEQFPIFVPGSGQNQPQISQDDQNSSHFIPEINMNRYSTLKTVAQGLMDIALLTSNISQLKYLLLIGPDGNALFYLLIVLIILSIILQVSCGLCILLIGTTDINKPENFRKAEKLNNWITVQLFLVSVLNIIISTLGIENLQRFHMKNA